MLEMNKTYDCDYIGKVCPDKWAIVTDVKRKAGAIETVKLLAIVNHGEEPDYLGKYLDNGIECEAIRTTENVPSLGSLSL